MTLNKQNLHIHTTYCDGRDTPEALVIEAIGRGFDSIGFAEHTYNQFSTYHHQMMPEKMGEYRDEIKAFDSAYIAPMVVGKLVSGICAVVLAMVLYRPTEAKREQN